MNHLATSKEDILAASRELIKENGWTAVSIRAVASRCSVSAGTIYNYYESKADLLGDTIESIWREIFFNPEDACWLFSPCFFAYSLAFCLRSSL